MRRRRYYEDVVMFFADKVERGGSIYNARLLWTLDCSLRFWNIVRSQLTPPTTFELQDCPSTPGATQSQSWPSNSYSVAPSRATPAGSLPLPPPSRSACPRNPQSRYCIARRTDMRQPQHAPLRIARQDSHHLELDPRRDLVRLPQEESARPLPHRVRLRTFTLRLAAIG
jgi:hypothetical protein